MFFTDMQPNYLRGAYLLTFASSLVKRATLIIFSAALVWIFPLPPLCLIPLRLCQLLSQSQGRKRREEKRKEQGGIFPHPHTNTGRSEQIIQKFLKLLLTQGKKSPVSFVQWGCENIQYSLGTSSFMVFFWMRRLSMQLCRGNSKFFLNSSDQQENPPPTACLWHDAS